MHVRPRKLHCSRASPRQRDSGPKVGGRGSDLPGVVPESSSDNEEIGVRDGDLVRGEEDVAPGGASPPDHRRGVAWLRRSPQRPRRSARCLPRWGAGWDRAVGELDRVGAQALHAEEQGQFCERSGQLLPIGSCSAAKAIASESQRSAACLSPSSLARSPSTRLRSGRGAHAMTRARNAFARAVRHPARSRYVAWSR